MYASANGHCEVVMELISLGANVNTQDNRGDSAVIIAVLEGYRDTLALLVNAGSDLNLQNHGGLTALMIAVRNGRWEMIRTLLEGDLDLQEHTGGWSALHFSAENGDSTATLALVSSGANVHLPDKNFLTPLKIAAMKLENEDSRLVPEWSAYYMNDYRGERDYGTVFRLLEMSPISISVPAHPVR
jgi:ankyrin repeat protein